MQVAKHKMVAITYTLTDDEDQILDQSVDGQPLEYLHGVGNLIPGLESHLEGKSTGDHLVVSIPPEDAYGLRVDELQQEVPSQVFAEMDDVEPGMQFRVPVEGGGYRIITVIEMGDETVTIDANHALAGMTLNFDVTISNVRDATTGELAQSVAMATDTQG